MLPNSGTQSFLASRLGLETPRNASGSGKRVRNERKKVAGREGLVWDSVEVTREHATTPEVQCNFCSKKFCGGATRIRQHIVDKCESTSPAFLAVKEKLIQVTDDKEEAKQQKVAQKEVDVASEMKVPVAAPGKMRQQSIGSSIAAATNDDLDRTIAEFFYACNIPPGVANHPSFKKMITIAKTAAPSYKTPDKQRLTGDLLDTTTAHLKAEEAPLREAVLKDSGTVVSDGWDDVLKNHLINFLVGSSKGFFFEGTMQLKSDDSEDAQKVADAIIGEIRKVGAEKIIQVVTDTCSVMKAAWKIIEKELPWITCTCCAPHVLSLELKDLAKIPDVAKVIEAVGKVLNRFWGRTRWARTKLREVAEKNHKKKIGLYRAKVTRFAGKVREMARMLRLKADLQEVVISSEYAAQKWKPEKEKEGEEGDADDEDDDTDGEDPIKKIILNETGFWKPLVAALKIMTPIVKLLRLCDGEKPAMGKVYDKMFLIGDAIEKSSVMWKDKAKKIHEDRWEYLHSFMHAAGYALDPEFMDVTDHDEATQNGLIEIIEKVSLRDEIADADKADYQGDPQELVDKLIDAPRVQKRIQTTMEELAKYQAREGIFTKLYVTESAKTMAPAAWWATYGRALHQMLASALGAWVDEGSAGGAVPSTHQRMRRSAIAAAASRSNVTGKTRGLLAQINSLRASNSTRHHYPMSQCGSRSSSTPQLDFQGPTRPLVPGVELSPVAIWEKQVLRSSTSSCVRRQSLTQKGLRRPSSKQLPSGSEGSPNDPFACERRSANHQSEVALPPVASPPIQEGSGMNTDKTRTVATLAPAPAPLRSARERAKGAMEAVLTLRAENYVELAFEATGLVDDDDAIAAAAAYDKRHVLLADAAKRHLVALEGKPTSDRIAESAHVVYRSVTRNRFVAPYVAPAVEEIIPVKRSRPRKKKERWRLETSIWLPRKLWGNSRDFFETPDALRKMFMADWDVAVRSHELGWLIVKCHHEPSMWRDIDRNGVHDEIDEVREVLWQHHRVLYGAFEYFSTLYSEVELVTGEPDVYNMSFNGYMGWVEGCKMLSKRCPHGEFETIWSIVNAVDRATCAEDKHNSKTTLNRQEFIQCLVRCAITIYVKRGTVGDVSDAVNHFMLSNLYNNLPERALQNSNAFRKRFCYIEQSSNVLEAHLSSLQTLYNAYAEVSHEQNDKLKNDEQMSIGEWLVFCAHVGLFETGQLTSLQAKYIFIWSRIRTADDLDDASEMKLRHLTFIDFMEAIVRMSILVALPADHELEEAGASDAGEFLLAMQAHSPNAYLQFLTSHRPKHKDPDGSDYEKHATQPVWRCIEHLIKLLVRTVEHNMTQTAAQGTAKGIDGIIEDHEAHKFLKRRSGGAQLERYSATMQSVDFEEALENAASKFLWTAAAIKIQMMSRMRRAKRRIAARKAQHEEEAATASQPSATQRES